MADEIHTTRDPDGTTHTTTVIDREPRRGGGIGVGLIVLVAIVIAAFFGSSRHSASVADAGSSSVSSLSWTAAAAIRPTRLLVPDQSSCGVETPSEEQRTFPSSRTSTATP